MKIQSVNNSGYSWRVWLLALPALVGCGGGGAADATAPELQGAVAAIQVAPDQTTVPVGQTLQLSVAALDADGNTLSDVPAPSFSSSDPGKATVSSSGLVTAVAEGSAIITASLEVEGRTLSATTTVQVVAADSPTPDQSNSSATVETTDLDTFAPDTVRIATGGSVTWKFTRGTHNVIFTGDLAPAGGNIPVLNGGATASRTFAAEGTYDYVCSRHNGMTGAVIVSKSAPAPVYSTLRLTPANASLEEGATQQLTATPLDQNGNALSGLPAPSFSSSDSGKATVSSSGLVTAVAAGPVTITASLTADGITHTATSNITVNAPASTAPTTPSSVTVEATDMDTFSPKSVSIPVGGTVTWKITGGTHNVTFQGTAPEGGNIPNLSTGGSASRTFSTAGTYNYLCDRHDGMTGTVVVGEGSTQPTDPTQPSAPTSATINGDDKSWSPSTVTIAEGGTVTWTMTKGDHDVTFTSGTPSGGNIPETDEGASVSRTFATPGTYTFECSKHADDGMTGTITVVAVDDSSTEPTAPTPSPSTATVEATDMDTFSPKSVSIAVGGTVTWKITGGTHNVTFQGTAPEGGNIPNLSTGGSASRTFSTAGTYNYLCDRHDGMTGTVTVK